MIKVLDYGRILELKHVDTEENGNKFRTIVQEFLEINHSQINNLKSGIEAEDFENLINIAKSIRSSSQFIGADELANSADALISLELLSLEKNNLRTIVSELNEKFIKVKMELYAIA